MDGEGAASACFGSDANISGYTNYSPPEYDLCVKDCDEALKLDRT